jgi:hypothetical protein
MEPLQEKVGLCGNITKQNKTKPRGNKLLSCKEETQKLSR